VPVPKLEDFGLCVALEAGQQGGDGSRVAAGGTAPVRR
jgi:hypothetical protein